VFLYGFAKSELENIRADQLRDFQSVGQGLLRAAAKEIEAAMTAGELMEVDYGQEKEKA